MRISLLMTDLLVNGGAQRQLLLLGHRLQMLGQEVRIYANRYSPEDCYPELTTALEIRAVRWIPHIQRAARTNGRHHGLFSGARRHLLESRELARLIADPGDILNPHIRGATRAAVYCKRRTGVPVVWMCDDARNWELPGYRPYYSPPVQWTFDRVMRRLEVPVVREIDHVVVLSRRVKEILEGFYGCRSSVIRSGLDPQAFEARPATRRKIRERHGIPQDAFLLLWLGIIEPHRRLEDALEAMRLVCRQRSDVRFLLVGSAAFAPEHVERLQRWVARHGLDAAVKFVLQSVPEAEMADYYSASDALVYLCENQSWGLGVFEAMACNLPVIVSRACGAEEVLEDRETGMLVPPRDPLTLCNVVLELAERRDLCQRLAERARARVLSEISWEKYARNMLDLFHRVIDERRLRRAATPREVPA